MSVNPNISEYAEECLQSARAAYGHIDGISDVEMLSLRISQLSRCAVDRIEYLDQITSLVRRNNGLLKPKTVKS